jgi:hypothetical protein
MHFTRRSKLFCLAPLPALMALTVSAPAACTGCTNFSNGTSLGAVKINALTEASGIAASQRNPGVLWTHNDGSQAKVYALSTNATLFATFNLTKSVGDVEDIAVGPGPSIGVSYLYVGDIGGQGGSDDVRSTVKILRIPEPRVDRPSGNPPSFDFGTVESFTLAYPDGSYDAETLLVDPVTSDLFVLTKESNVARMYRANLNGLSNSAKVTMSFVRTVSFDNASGGDISADGTQIVLRQENFARLWLRCDSEPISNAFNRPPKVIPVIGEPDEPNGEGIALLRDGTGYVTISEGEDPEIYYFPSTCPRPPQFTGFLSNQSALLGSTVEFRAYAIGQPPPTFSWRFNGQLIAGATGEVLTLFNVTPANSGTYSIIASNAVGVATNSAALVVRPKPELRVTEAMAVASSTPGLPTADWWELTSFESSLVNLSGWRFNDNTGGLLDAFVLPDGLTILPRESIVFVEGITAVQFQNWWGASTLPPGMKIVSYSGTGLNFSSSGDGIRLWDNRTVDADELIASVDFGAATAGVSFNYDPIAMKFGELSRLGINGVSRAALATDIGSPGRILAPAEMPVLIVTLSTERIRIQFDATAGHRYALEGCDTLSPASWVPTGDVLVAAQSGPAFFERDLVSGNRFYRSKVD